MYDKSLFIQTFEQELGTRNILRVNASTDRSWYWRGTSIIDIDIESDDLHNSCQIENQMACIIWYCTYVEEAVRQLEKNKSYFLIIRNMLQMII